MNNDFTDARTGPLPWTYRVAQNPRVVWLFWIVFELAIAGLMIKGYFSGVRRGEVSMLLVGAAFMAFAPLMWTVGGFPVHRPPPYLDGSIKRIPSGAVWSIHVPFLVLLLGFGSAVILDFERPIMQDTWTMISHYILLILGILTIFFALLSIVVAGHRRILVFRPDSLRYERGWFRANIPWDAITDLRPVADANVKHPGNVTRPSRDNLRAGVQVTVRETEGLYLRRKTMLHRIDGHNVIGVDCSSYRIDPNTLINAIYLVTEHPELRTLLDQPAGAELFVGPNWNTRRKMSVGDTWDRHTNRITTATESTKT